MVSPQAVGSEILLRLVLSELVLCIELAGGPHPFPRSFLPCLPPDDASNIPGPQIAVVFEALGCF